MAYKDSSKIWSIFAIMMAFSSCGSSQKLDKTPPSAWTTPYLQKLPSGFQLIMVLQEPTSLVLDSIYFRNQQVKLQQDDTDPKTYSGFFAQEIPELIMSSDPNKEFANQPPTALSRRDIPFELATAECVVGYFQGKRKRYTKYVGVQEKEVGL